MRKKALSPVIATVMLVSLGVVLALIIFTWGGKFLGTLSPPVNCEDVGFSAEIVNEKGIYVLYIANHGKEKLEGFVIKSVGERDINVIEEVLLEINPGASESIELKETGKTNGLLIVPKINVETLDEFKVLTCSDNFGEEI